MKKILFFIFTVVLASCTNDTDFVENNTIETIPNMESRILQERDPSLTTILSKRKYDRKLLTRSTAANTDAEKMLGYSYKIENGNSIMGDVANIGFPIVDLDRYEDMYPSAVKRIPVHMSDLEINTYSDYERVDHQTAYSHKFKHGFEFDLKIFKISRKRITQQKFNNYTLDSSTDVFGELNAYVRHKNIEMNLTENVRKRCAADYLDKLFIDALYNSTMVDLLNCYGEFVVTGYYTGGRASALYYGKTKVSKDSLTREGALESAIEASYKTDSVSGNISIGIENGSSYQNTYNQTFSGLKYTAHTIGGSYGYPIITSAKDISEITNFSKWMGSLDTESTHSLIDLVDNSLYPMSDFILEENFKARYEDTLNKLLDDDELVIPYIDIMRVYMRKGADGTKLYTVAPVLTTRQGDKIILTNSSDSNLSDTELKANNTLTVFNAKADSIKNTLKDIFKLQIKQVYNNTINPYLRNPLTFSLDDVDFSNMKKFTNSNSGITYFYDTNSRIAFSFYGDFILEDYGLDNWFEDVDTQNRSMQSLYNSFRIFGL